MSDRVSHEELMRYLDGEISPEERQRIENAIAGSTELRREVAVYRSVKEDLSSLELGDHPRSSSIWNRVARRLTRPVGWTLILAGMVVWTAYGTYTYVTSPMELWEKLATGGIVIGILVLLAGVIMERYQEYLTDPYRDVQR